MNIASLIQEKAQTLGCKPAVVWAPDVGVKNHYQHYDFATFEKRSNQLANRLTRKGIKVGSRVLLFMRPCLDFSVMTFALFKVGAVPVLIDPGMGMKNLLKAVAEVKPHAMIAVKEVLLFSAFKRAPFRTVTQKFGYQESWLVRDNLLKNLAEESGHFPMYPAKDEELSCILFTSGGTGAPKGVLYTHGILAQQTRMLQDMFALTEQDKDLPGFPLFALFTLAMGMTSVIPHLDPTAPAKCDPAKIVQQILEQDITFAAGSPAIWERVAHHCLGHNIQLPSIRHVVMFGAPVRGELHEMFAKILPNGTTHTPYGATECLPVSCISGRELLGELIAQHKMGKGTCIGRVVTGNQIKILKISDIPKNELDEVISGEMGEIVVHGPVVTQGYFENIEATEKAKIKTAQGLWHRMGDMGHIDQQGRLWFAGRVAHRVETNNHGVSYPIPTEAIFNQHPKVKRTALVKLTKDKITIAGLCVELKEQTSKEQLISELKSLGKKHVHTQHIHDFFIHPAFPVDVRHNIKIDRVALSIWAQEQLT